jgi:hypothetical protein
MEADAADFRLVAAFPPEHGRMSALINAIEAGPVSGSTLPMAVGFWTGSAILSEHMLIDAAGRARTGTTSPQVQLDVAGALRVGTYEVASQPAP